MKVKVERKSRGPAPQSVQISSSFIKLDAFLKFAALVETGGIAKAMIQDGEVAVNGEKCTQRGKKLVSGDIVTLAGKSYQVSGISGDEA